MSNGQEIIWETKFSQFKQNLPGFLQQPFCLFYHQIFALRLDEEQTLEFSSNGFRQKKCKHLSAEGRSEKTGRKTVADVYRILAQFSSREVFDKDFFQAIFI